MSSGNLSAEIARSLDLSGDAVPLRVDNTGTLRVGQTRVTLDTVIAAFCSGESAEVIAHSYPTLHLDQVYAVIAYYLKHQQDVDHYLAERRREAGELRRQVESICPPDALRAKLLARMQAKGLSGHAQAGNG